MLLITRPLAAVIVGVATLGAIHHAKADDLVIVALPPAAPGEPPKSAVLTAVATTLANSPPELGPGASQAAIRVEPHEAACTPDGATQAARAIAERHPVLVIGHACGAIPAARIYAAAGIPFFAIGARHPELTDRRAGPGVFRFAGRDDGQGSFTGRWLATHYETRPVAVVADQTRYSKRLVEQTRAAYKALRGQEPPVIWIVAGEKDYTAALSELRRHAPAAIYFAGFPVEAALILRHVRRAGIATDFIASDAVGVGEFTELAGPDANGVRVVRPYTPTLPSKEQHNPAPAQTPHMAPSPRADDSHVLWAQAAAETWLQARRAASATAEPDRQRELIRQIQTGSYRTTIGEVSFAPNGDIHIASFAIAEIRAGAFRWESTR